MTFQYAIDADKPLNVKKILLDNLSSSESEKSTTTFLFIWYSQNPLTCFIVTQKFLFSKKIWFYFFFLYKYAATDSFCHLHKKDRN